MAIGGDDTLSVAQKLHETGIKVVGVPKTIDNDLGGTDYTFGFDTACNIVCEAIDRIHTTAEAHNRVMVVEVMGRDAGWIALYSGVSGRRRRDPDSGATVRRGLGRVAESIWQRHERGRYFSIVVVAEGGEVFLPMQAPDLPFCRTWARTSLWSRQAGRHRQYSGSRD